MFLTFQNQWNSQKLSVACFDRFAESVGDFIEAIVIYGLDGYPMVRTICFMQNNDCFWKCLAYVNNLLDFIKQMLIYFSKYTNNNVFKITITICNDI